MKKNMTTFEMAQAAYENPGKVFRAFGTRVKWDCDSNRVVVIPQGFEYCLSAGQVGGYVWEEERTPRKWSGEYVCRNGIRQSGDHTYHVVPDGVTCRVKWEAEEVL